jgi:hypothetical protein
MSLSAVAGYVLRVLFGMFPYVVFWGETRLSAERPKLSDPAHEGARLQPGRDGRVRCSAWLGDFVFMRESRECSREDAEHPEESPPLPS